MKRQIIKAFLLFSLITGWVCYGASAQTGEILTNNDVVKLTKLNLAPTSIIRKIKTSNSNFDVSVDALVALKQQGVDKDVINEMIDVSSQNQGDAQAQYGQDYNQNGADQPAPQTGQGNAPYQNGQRAATEAYSDAPKNYNDPKTWRKEGIYYYNSGDAGNLFVPVDASEISGMKTGGYGTMVAQYYTYGFARNKQEAVVSGTYSKRQIHQSTPSFYFYFNADNISPNQFTLVRFIEKRDSRVMVVGSSNYYERSRGIDEKEKVDFTYDQVGEGIYKVYTKRPLKEGEYCFMYTGSAKTPFSNAVYDFGISISGN